MTAKATLSSLAADLAAGRTTSIRLVEDCLDRIANESGEGKRAFLRVASQSARTAAAAMDKLRAAGAAPSPYAGIPISIKDLFDIAGDVTTAGSRVLADAPPAAADAPVVARLRRAGFVVVGRTNMTEFAYSGLGINPHFGTPLNPWDRASGRIPGGSSSGAAVSVADGMAHAGLGTDTGGSCRIPAAFTGLVGFKPTARRIPLAGSVPLSTSLDSIGPIARSARCCAVVDAVLAGEALRGCAVSLAGLRIGVPQTVVQDGMDPPVAQAFAAAVSRLAAAGAHIKEFVAPEFDEIPQLNAKGGFAAAESYAWHRRLIETKSELYDPRVLSRIAVGERQGAADYIDLLEGRRSLIHRIALSIAGYDVLAMPTVPILPPLISAVEAEEEYRRLNLLILRNSALVNLFDGCAISLPMTTPGDPPIGLMLAAAGGRDAELFAVAEAVEAELNAAL